MNEAVEDGPAGEPPPGQQPRHREARPEGGQRGHGGHLKAQEDGLPLLGAEAEGRRSGRAQWPLPGAPITVKPCRSKEARAGALLR